MLILTKHFCERWQRRVGNWPTEDGVGKVLRESIKIQTGRVYLLQGGARYNVLSIYWHPELDLILKLDHDMNTAVTVMSPECRRLFEGRGGNGKNSPVKKKGYNGAPAHRDRGHREGGRYGKDHRQRKARRYRRHPQRTK